jgi:hypothetical protein
VRTILPSDNLEIMMDIHFIVDGLVPITHGRPICFEKEEWFDLNHCNCIVGDDTTASVAHVHRILGQFSDISKRAEEQYHVSNQGEKVESNAVISISMHFIIEFTHNPSIHIYFLFISLLNILYVKEKKLQR